MGDTEPVKVTIRGVTYPSITAAAKALGVSRAAIHQGMTNGIIDNVGLRKPPVDDEDQLTARALTLPKIKALLDALMPVWQALLGPPHYIRELQAIARLPDTPLVRLRDAIAALPSNPVDDKKPDDPDTK